MEQSPAIKKPLISINLITYNRANFLTQAIESVLAQNFFDWELIIIDDCSQDETETLLKTYSQNPQIKYWRNEKNLGIGLSRNRALAKSQGEYIAILDSDDYWLDHNKLKRQIAFLDDNRDHVLVGTGFVVVDEKNQKLKTITPLQDDRDIRYQLLSKNPLSHSSVVYRREPVLELTGYRPDINGVEDYDLWLRLGVKGKFHNLSSPSLAYRIHQNNITSTDRLRLMTLNLELVKRYSPCYPNQKRAFARRWLRLQLFELWQKISRQS